MTKTLSWLNVLLFGFIYSISLVFVGYFRALRWGSLQEGMFYMFFIPGVHLCLLIMSFYFAMKPGYSKNYYIASAVTVCLAFVLFAILYGSYYDNYLVSLEYDDKRYTQRLFIDSIQYPTTVLIPSVIIAINYIICGIKAKKELGY